MDIGFLSEEEQSYWKESIAWKEATKQMLGAHSSSEDDLVQSISSKTSFKSADEKGQLVAGLKWRKYSLNPREIVSKPVLTRQHSRYLFGIKNHAKGKPIGYTMCYP